jgi:hypothetical protein
MENPPQNQHPDAVEPDRDPVKDPEASIRQETGRIRKGTKRWSVRVLAVIGVLLIVAGISVLACKNHFWVAFGLYGAGGLLLFVSVQLVHAVRGTKPSGVNQIRSGLADQARNFFMAAVILMQVVGLSHNGGESWLGPRLVLAFVFLAISLACSIVIVMRACGTCASLADCLEKSWVGFLAWVISLFVFAIGLAKAIDTLIQSGMPGWVSPLLYGVGIAVLLVALFWDKFGSGLVETVRRVWG